MGNPRKRRNLNNPGGLRWIILGLMIVAVASFLVGAALDPGSGFNWSGLMLNLGTELGGAVVTYLLLTELLGKAEEQQGLKEKLIRQMGSRINEEAIRAVEELRAYGWLEDGSLRGKSFVGAALQGANLRNANLQEAHLERASLEGAILSFTELQDAHLVNANLQGAHLHFARLQGADLMVSESQGAFFIGANMQGARLQYADLRRACFDHAKCLTVVQLEFAKTLEGAKFPGRSSVHFRVPPSEPEPDWHTRFRYWSKEVEVDEDGYIVVEEIDRPDERDG